MKKLVSLLLALAMALSAVSAFAATLDEVQAAGKIVMSSSPDFPPFENLVVDIGTGAVDYEGIEIDIMNIVAEKLGVTLDIKPTDFDFVLTDVANGAADIGVSGFTVTEHRKQNVLFSDVYYLAAQVVVVTEDSPIAAVADLAGKKVAVQSGTTAEVLCLEAGYDMSAFKANVDAELALVKVSVDAWVIDNTVAKRMVEEYNQTGGAQLKILEEPLTEEPYAFAFAFGSETLVDAVNAVLGDLMASGDMAAIFEAYGEAYEVPAAQ